MKSWNSPVEQLKLQNLQSVMKGSELKDALRGGWFDSLDLEFEVLDEDLFGENCSIKCGFHSDDDQDQA